MRGQAPHVDFIFLQRVALFRFDWHLLTETGFLQDVPLTASRQSLCSSAQDRYNLVQSVFRGHDSLCAGAKFAT
jgi:hypothetical protein